MRFWSREIAGWALVGLGLFFFYMCLAFVSRPVPRFLETGPLLIIGVFLFRGGIHLLKVAVAARICLQAREDIVKLTAEAAKAGRRRNGSS